MQINDLAARIESHRPLLRAALDRVLASGWLVLGAEVRGFEAAFAGYLGAAHCVSVGNGTDALELGLRALGVRPGEPVATVANAGMYATTAILAAGATPLFMDVDRRTRNVTLDQVNAAIGGGARAVVVTHLYGLAVADIEGIARQCAAAGVPLLEDCAQAHGARVAGRRVGTFGDAAAFSFYPTKNLGALGDGGAVATNRDDVAASVTRLRQYGWERKYEVTLAGGRNSRLDELQAAALSAFLPTLDAANARRREIALAYGQGIRHPSVEQPQFRGDDFVAHLHVIATARRDDLRQHLKERGIASDVHYPVPDHRQPVFGDRFAAVALPQTERLAREVLTLPCYPEMTDEQVRQVIDAVNGWAA